MKKIILMLLLSFFSFNAFADPCEFILSTSDDTVISKASDGTGNGKASDGTGNGKASDGTGNGKAGNDGSGDNAYQSYLQCIHNVRAQDGYSIK